MNGNSILVILGLLIFIGLPIAGVFLSVGSLIFGGIKDKVKAKREEKAEWYVKATSTLLRDLQSLNARQSFHDLQKSYPFTFDCYSKPDFDRFDFYTQFCDLCYRKSKDFREILKQAKENRSKYESYEKEYSQILSRIPTSGLGYEYRDLEKKKLTDLKLTPVCDPQITVTKQYITPKGKNHYRLSQGYAIDKIESAINARRDADERERLYKAHIERERALVTDRLRYQVMQRDKFRCQICGASQADGVQLHVDHIKPVSKGGKTEMKNLRTLCDRCNRGKGNLYDKSGVN